MGVKGSLVIKRLSEFIKLFVIRRSILYLFFTVNCTVKYTANWFAIKGKYTVGQGPIKPYLAPFINSFQDAKRKPSVIGLTSSSSRETQYKFYITSNPQVICGKTHPTDPYHLYSQVIRWRCPANWLFYLPSVYSKDFFSSFLPKLRSFLSSLSLNVYTQRNTQLQVFYSVLCHG